MKAFSCFLPLCLAAGAALAAQNPATERIKSELIGHTMGGGRRSWKFQTVDQIKQLTIKGETETAKQRDCIISLRLQATNTPVSYAAEARVVYIRTPAGWTFDHVGLLSLEKIK